MSQHRPRLPRWVLPTVAAVAGTLAFLWTLNLDDSHGKPLIDSTAVGILTVVSPVLIVILQRTRTADHELRPNSGSSTKDQMNRVEVMLGDVIRDIGGIRSDIRRQDRRADAQEQRINDIDDQVDELRLSATTPRRDHHEELPREEQEGRRRWYRWRGDRARRRPARTDRRRGLHHG